MAHIHTQPLDGLVKGILLLPESKANTGVVVLGGSSGRVDVSRARLFADLGASALALQWFGGSGQSPGICEIPLETFSQAIDHLYSLGCERILLVGTSKGAEAALLVATLDPRVNAVVAISPTSVVWGNIGAGVDGSAWPERSSWSHEGQPLDFVPADTTWQPVYREGLVSYRSFFEACLRLNPVEALRSAIAIERTAADIVLVAGGDDALWPSDIFAQELADRVERHDRRISLIADPDAGHRVLFPGEVTPRSTKHAHGGTDAADIRLGLAAWQKIVTLI